MAKNAPNTDRIIIIIIIIINDDEIFSPPPLPSLFSFVSPHRHRHRHRHPHSPLVCLSV
jgi:hypothetical protein